MYSDEKQNIQAEKPTQDTIKVDGINVQDAARHFEKNMYKNLKNRLNAFNNKTGRPSAIPTEEKEKGRTR